MGKIEIKYCAASQFIGQKKHSSSLNR